MLSCIFFNYFLIYNSPLQGILHRHSICKTPFNFRYQGRNLLLRKKNHKYINILNKYNNNIDFFLQEINGTVYIIYRYGKGGK